MEDKILNELLDELASAKIAAELEIKAIKTKIRLHLTNQK